MSEAIYINRNPSSAVKDVIGASFGKTVQVVRATKQTYYVRFHGDERAVANAKRRLLGALRTTLLF